MLLNWILFAIIITLVGVRIYRYGMCRIKEMTGVEQNCYIHIRGTKQYIQLRGNNVNNPVILMLNPGNSVLQNFTTYIFRKELIDEYTLVYWDQRGCGRTLFANKREKVLYDDLVKDLEEVVDYLRERFRKEKIILLGYDWGTLLGVDYISKYPDKVQAYISVEQFIDIKETLEKSTERAMNMYKKNKRKGAHLLFHLISKFNTDKVLGNEISVHYFILNKRINQKLYSVSFAERLKRIWLVITSPDLEPRDVRWLFIRILRFYPYMQMFEDVISKNMQVNIVEKYGVEFKVPFYLLYGEMDYFVCPDMIKEFYQNLSCPRKNLVELLHAGHEPFLTNPESFCSAVKHILNEVKY